ncbi:MAG: LptF/LptG family permease [Crocinitomix sp.]|nr:LptF/LptG family permease [Crocinitomix sp.]
MKKLNIFIIKSFVGPFMITFFIAMFFLVMQFFWKYVDDLMGKGLEISVLLELLFYVSATLIPLALPLAVLFSSIMTFGNLSEKNELTALKSSGLSLFRVMRPMLVFIIFLSMGAFYFSNYILPVANLKWRTIIYNIQQKKPTFGITEGIFYSDIKGYSIKVEEKNDNTGELVDILIYEVGKNGQGKTIIAERGEMLKSADSEDTTVTTNFLLLKLINGSMYEQIGPTIKNATGAPYQKSFFTEAIIKFDLSGFDMQEESEDLFKRDFEMMNFVQLGIALDSLEGINDTLAVQFEKNIQRQITIVNPDLIARGNATDTTLLGQEESMLKIDTIIVLSDLKQMEYSAALTAAQNKIRATKDLIYTQTIIRKSREGSLRDYKAAWHKKFTLSFAILVLFFIGAPLGAIIRKGGLGAPLIFATLFFLLYYVLMISGENVVESGFLTVWKGMWLSAFILTPIGIFLTYKAANDSALFDRDVYKKFFRKLIGKENE